MDSTLIVLIVAALAIGIAWKLLKGLVKTVALVAVLAVAGVYVFGGAA